MFKKSSFVKIRVTVPLEQAEKVRLAMSQAGAGEQGNYSNCSFSVRGLGRFMPLNGSHPSIGEQNKSTEVPEEMIEMLCHTDLVKKVVKELKKAHPYEEPAIDIVERLELE